MNKSINDLKLDRNKASMKNTSISKVHFKPDLANLKPILHHLNSNKDHVNA